MFFGFGAYAVALAVGRLGAPTYGHLLLGVPGRRRGVGGRRGGDRRVLAAGQGALLRHDHPRLRGVRADPGRAVGRPHRRGGRALAPHAGRVRGRSRGARSGSPGRVVTYYALLDDLPRPLPADEPLRALAARPHPAGHPRQRAARRGARLPHLRLPAGGLLVRQRGGGGARRRLRGVGALREPGVRARHPDHARRAPDGDHRRHRDARGRAGGRRGAADRADAPAEPAGPRRLAGGGLGDPAAPLRALAPLLRHPLRAGGVLLSRGVLGTLREVAARRRGGAAPEA